MELFEVQALITLIKENGFTAILVILLLFFVNKIFGKIFMEYLNYNKEMLKERNNHINSTNLLATHLQTLSNKIPDAIQKMNLDVISLKAEISTITAELKNVVTKSYFDDSNELLHQALLKINEKLDNLLK